MHLPGFIPILLPVFRPAQTPEGAKASATLYSLIEMAKANGLEPYRYLRHLFENLPHAYTADEYTALMPHKIEPDSLVVHF